MIETQGDILFVDEVHPILLDGLVKLGFDCHYQPGISRAEAIQLIKGSVGLVVRSGLKVDEEFINAAQHLKFIARAGAGMDNIDEVYARKKGIKCLNAPEGNADAVGEHAVGLLLNLTRNIVRSFHEVLKRQWRREENRGEELTELTIGIIGYGNTGQAVAKKLSGFGCRIMYYDKLEIDFPNNPAERVEKEILLKKADIISIHIPLDDQNRGLINREFIESVSKPFYFLNLSRGEIMIVEDILAGLNSGKIKAAAFDVWDNENPDLWNDAEIQRFEQFVKTNRVVFTPHIAGWTFASYKKISEVLLRKIEFECSYFKN